MMDLCLASNQYHSFPVGSRRWNLQLLGLPRRQDLAHGVCGDLDMKLKESPNVLPPQGYAPDRRGSRQYLSPCVYPQMVGECFKQGTEFDFLCLMFWALR